MNTRIMAVALVAVSLLSVRAAQAQGEAVDLVREGRIGEPLEIRLDLVREGRIGGPLEFSLIGSGFVIIVIGPPDPGSNSFAGCGALGAFGPWEAIEVVVIKPGTPALRRTMYHLPGLEPAPGTRIGNFPNDVNECCHDQAAGVVSCVGGDHHSRIRRTTGSVILSGSAGSALFSSSVELAADSIGVVTGQPNYDGTHRVIFKKQGSPAQQVDIDSDVELLPADVLRDLIDLGQDPDTGEHLYLADIEW